MQWEYHEHHEAFSSSLSLLFVQTFHFSLSNDGDVIFQEHTSGGASEERGQGSNNNTNLAIDRGQEPNA
jgi:hypothetical protein